MHRLVYQNFDDHETLVMTHSVPTANSQPPVGIRWYEIRNPASPVVWQQSTFAPDGNSRWMGSIAMDNAGDIAVGYSESSSSMFPKISYTGRTPADPLNTLEAEVDIFLGVGSQTVGNRWGDYTALTVDPVDDCSFWYTNEYLSIMSVSWHTRIGSFKFPGCSLPQTFSFANTVFRSGAVEYHAASSIEAGNTTIITGPARITFEARVIRLEPSFRATASPGSGVAFHAKLQQ